MGSPCKCWPRALVVAVGGILIGCASVGALFVSYSDTMQPMRQQLQVGQWSEALAAIPESTAKDNNYVLDRLQQGRIAFLLGDWKTSQRNLAAAATELNWLDQQAEFRVSDGLQQAGSLLSNDQTIAYQAPDYEQTLLHLQWVEFDPHLSANAQDVLQVRSAIPFKVLERSVRVYGSHAVR